MVVHPANRLSPFTAEIDDGPLSGVTHPPAVESDTDSVEFHAIHTPAHSDSDEDIDDDFGGNSEPEDVEEASTLDPPHEDIAPIDVNVALVAMASGFRSPDQVTLDTEFRSRGCLIRVVPKIMRGAFRTALRFSFQEAAEARAAGNVEQEIRAWKLFLFVPRMLLTRPPRGGAVSKAKLVERCDAFARGEWLLLVKASRADVQSSSTATSRRRRREDRGDEMGRRARRVLRWKAHWWHRQRENQGIIDRPVIWCPEHPLLESSSNTIRKTKWFWT